MRISEAIYTHVKNEDERKWLIDSAAIPAPISMLTAIGVTDVSNIKAVHIDTPFGPISCSASAYIITRPVPLPPHAPVTAALPFPVFVIPELTPAADRSRLPTANRPLEMIAQHYLFTPGAGDQIRLAANDLALLTDRHPSVFIPKRMGRKNQPRLSIPVATLDPDVPAIERVGTAVGRAFSSARPKSLIWPLIPILISLLILGSPLAGIVFLFMRTLFGQSQGYVLTKDAFLEILVTAPRRKDKKTGEELYRANSGKSLREVKETKSLISDLERECMALVEAENDIYRGFMTSPAEYAPFYSKETQSAFRAQADLAYAEQSRLDSLPPVKQAQQDIHEIMKALMAAREALQTAQEAKDQPLKATVSPETWSKIAHSRKELTGFEETPVPITDYRHIKESGEFTTDLPSLPAPAKVIPTSPESLSLEKNLNAESN